MNCLCLQIKQAELLLKQHSQKYKGRNWFMLRQELMIEEGFFNNKNHKNMLKTVWKDPRDQSSLS